MKPEADSPARRRRLEACLEDARILWDYHAVGQPIAAADVLVCLGSYDSRVAVRSAQLLREDVAPIAVVTGGHGNWTRGTLARPEAEVFAAVIEQHGVARERLILDTQATNIGENVAFARRALEGRPVRGAVFVTKPQTQRRVWATVRKQWPAVECRVTAPQLDLESQAHDDAGLLRLIEEMVGDLQRLQEYPAAGFQIPMEIPGTVLQAYGRLRAAGFEGHCLR